MSASFRKFDYRVRPAKQIERRMIGECLTRLTRIGDVSAFPYVGFGSVAFMDFVMMHRLLGSRCMVSIEHADNAPRMQHNRPYKCIEVRAGTSHERLGELSWNSPMIVWLDYDKLIDEKKILDVGLCAERMLPGSFLLVTLPYESGGDLSAAEAAFKKAVPSRYYSGVSESSFAGERYPRTIRSVLSAEINHRLGKREAGTEKTSEGDLVEKVELTQVLFFTYRDGTRMLTLGWFVDDAKSEKRLLDICKFQELSTYRNGAVPLSIKPPVLTPLEIRALNSQLPSSGAAPPTCPGLSAKEIEDYSSLYRYFPVYFEVAEA